MARNIENDSKLRQDSVIKRLPGALGHVWDWQLRARCRGMDSSVFYSPDGERGTDKQDRETQAKKICNPCPVKTECLVFAFEHEELYGVWGGMTEDERRNLLKSGNKKLPTL
ncbi:MAG: WhiB family transcriptional regulator [Candidatus Levybacteria bacterium]|nr:WhiB family transcriptional regulator [Candidatus Levybacteria bacterium]